MLKSCLAAILLAALTVTALGIKAEASEYVHDNGYTISYNMSSDLYLNPGETKELKIFTNSTRYLYDVGWRYSDASGCISPKATGFGTYSGKDGSVLISAVKPGTAKVTASIRVTSAEKDIRKRRTIDHLTLTCKVTVRDSSQSNTASNSTNQNFTGYISVDECYETLNFYRKTVGRSPLIRNATLENMAKTRAKELSRFYSHDRPDGSNGLSIIPGWQNLYTAENIDMGQKSCTEVMSCWYLSQGHYQNMVRKEYKYVGIAGYKINGKTHWVQLFSS